MTTTSAKELRENLSNIRQRVMAGETFEVIYRSRPVMRITPITNQTSRYSGVQTGKRLDALLKDLPKNASPRTRDSTKSYKQLRDEMYRQDPKYRQYIYQKKTVNE